jgi:hypothetical protein
MTVSFQSTIEAQVKLQGTEANKALIASAQRGLSVDQFIQLAIQRFIQETLGEEEDWQRLSLEQFQVGLDNAEDAIYDNWREHYGIPAR